MRTRHDSGSSLVPMCIGFALAVALHVVGYFAWQRYGAASPPAIRVVDVAPRPSASPHPRTTAKPKSAVAAAPRSPARPQPAAAPAVASVSSVTVAAAPRAAAPTRTVAAAAVPAAPAPSPAMEVPNACVKMEVPTVSYPEWNNFQKLGIPEPCAAVKTRAATMHTWPDVLGVLEMNVAEVLRRPLVEPYCLGQHNPNLADFGSLNGRTGRVMLDCALTADGHPTVTVVPSGDPLLDRIALKLGNDTMWLPALREGKPVDYRFSYVIVFTACDYH